MIEEISRNFEMKKSAIDAVISNVLENKYSDFYREKYGHQSLSTKSYLDFSKIPILTKKEIIATPIDKRTFVPREEVAYYSWTSGTTEINKPLIVPRSERSLEIFRNSRIKEIGVKKVLIMFRPSSNLYSRLRQFDNTYTLIPGDIHNISMTAFIASEIGIDAVETVSSALYYLILELEKLNFNLSKIRWVSIGGEYITKARYDFYQSKLPNAIIETRYANSESGGNVGFQCKYLRERGPSFFHLAEEYFLEILDINMQPQKEDDFGQIVLTDSIIPKAFPDIRYSTGDLAKYSAQKCKCGLVGHIELKGKSASNAFSYGGMLFHTKPIEYAFQQSLGLPLSNYKLHIEETINNYHIDINLRLVLEKGLKIPHDFEVNFKKFFFLSQAHNLDYFLKQGIVNKFTVEKSGTKNHFKESTQKIFLDETICPGRPSHSR